MFPGCERSRRVVLATVAGSTMVAYASILSATLPNAAGHVLVASIVSAPAGVLLAAVVTPMLLPVIGWRGMFAVGLFPAIAAYFIRRSLHEPDVFVERSAKAPGASPLRLLVADAQARRSSLGLWPEIQLGLACVALAAVAGVLALLADNGLEHEPGEPLIVRRTVRADTPSASAVSSSPRPA